MAIEKNQIVSIEYEVSDGEKVVDSNIGGMPLVFMFGKGQIIPGLENAIANMSIGEKAEVLVKSQDAYGEYEAEAKQEVPKDQFAGIDLEVGMTLYGQGEDGGTVQVIVKEIGSENVIIDFNHPLAGKDLSFIVIVNNIREASAEEVMSGIPVENQHDDCCGTGGGSGCGC
ncbi:MAG: peptidylprolyl isomerase [Sulfurimonas sp. RIFCSPHIGHO2_12_FULL_36_9]|uniref:FKBP-type peptidyl-prolyl cis-trans isomerase n=1 Tax=unclassified Sulfurimonas TaxID=2623549 RepID=UPI0008B7989C|nr:MULTISPECIES: peptidylprolyl isomerase [unclassified Sulfurimonas]OHD97679.1 MAG: peptidylprolyl isomerase [Sulfurimonas sp. RIFCSPHIGHO2_12_FULL_36_9]OHD98105.1 MAG: peptidylprolyl isomerase [Sulfurimonas sp. RIFCSPLOWO2_02_FULL_36_28]OHE02244.1 MAG: peptidylprolyl isomerase [Sulfurimonas sp. RIFCSPLOWO2_12_36_12]OHE03113.1 MAG: peptidylprolyl isomerase [Sulfurimonas sp. RIFCSPLOWO2_12_FULL_36_74]